MRRIEDREGSRRRYPSTVALKRPAESHPRPRSASRRGTRPSGRRNFILSKRAPVGAPRDPGRRWHARSSCRGDHSRRRSPVARRHPRRKRIGGAARRSGSDRSGRRRRAEQQRARLTSARICHRFGDGRRRVAQYSSILSKRSMLIRVRQLRRAGNNYKYNHQGTYTLLPNHTQCADDDTRATPDVRGSTRIRRRPGPEDTPDAVKTMMTLLGAGDGQIENG